MGQCYKCKDHFPPDFMFAIEHKPIQECVFCRSNITEVTLENENGDVVGRMTKQECINRYKEFTSDMGGKEGIKKIVKNEMKIIT
jgi:hypothetical protein